MRYSDEIEVNPKAAAKFIFTVVAVVGLCLGAGLWGCPQYNVYSKEMKGRATLAEAQSARMAAVVSAKAAAESAVYESNAEVARAKGAAEANKIIGDSLKDNEGYLRYLYINNMAKTQNQVIYVPTEAGLPILEAGRRPNHKPVAPAE